MSVDVPAAPRRPAQRTQGSLRVALLAGTLGQGGAEKQLVYIARALTEAGVFVRVYCLTQGEYYEPILRHHGIEVVWIGRRDHPAARVLRLGSALRRNPPHVVHALHFYTNLYAVLAASTVGALAIGSLRSDTLHELEANGRWGPWLLRVPRALIANSEAACRNARQLGVPATRMQVLPNVIKLEEFDAAVGRWRATPRGDQEIRVISVARLVGQKRLDRFLEVLALARQRCPRLRGVLVGEGPERATLMGEAARLGLSGHVDFLGQRDDVPALLAAADLMLLTSDHEGFPNAVLEAMAAGVPVVTTPAGDAGTVVEHGLTGYVVPATSPETMADRLVELASAPELRRRLGEHGRARAADQYEYRGLADRILAAYSALANERRHAASIGALVTPG
jgi:glycosyltransferase involved in cell wall biosynthesis